MRGPEKNDPADPSQLNSMESNERSHCFKIIIIITRRKLGWLTLITDGIEFKSKVVKRYK